MRKPVTLSLDEQLLEAIRQAAADDGVPEERVFEEALRRYFGLRGLTVLAEIADRQSEADRLSDEEAMGLAVAELRALRSERRPARVFLGIP